MQAPVDTAAWSDGTACARGELLHGHENKALVEQEHVRLNELFGVACSLWHVFLCCLQAATESALPSQQEPTAHTALLQQSLSHAIQLLQSLLPRTPMDTSERASLQQQIDTLLQPLESPSNASHVSVSPQQQDSGAPAAGPASEWAEWDVSVPVSATGCNCLV